MKHFISLQDIRYDNHVQVRNSNKIKAAPIHQAQYSIKAFQHSLNTGVVKKTGVIKIYSSEQTISLI